MAKQFKNEPTAPTAAGPQKPVAVVASQLVPSVETAAPDFAEVVVTAPVVLVDPPAVEASPKDVLPPAVVPAVEAKPAKSFNVTVPGVGPRVIVANTIEDVVRQVNGPAGDGKGQVYTAKQLKISEVK